MPNPILASPEAYLRAINAPPILGPYSATMSVPYQSGGIGVGPGGRLEVKDAAGVADAARAWAAAMAQQPANPYVNMVFGDSPGQASQMAIGLRNQRAAEAAAAAQRAQEAQKFMIQQEALRQANLLNAQIKMAQVQENAAVRRDATEQRREASREQLLAKLLGGSGSGSGSGTAGPGIDVTALLQNKENLRTAGANLEAQQQALYNQQFLAARQAAEQFPGYVVAKGTARNPAPSIDYVGDPSKQSDEALRVIQTAMLGQTTPKPVEAWTDWDWSRFYGSGETPMTGPGFLDQLQNLQAQQAAAKANLATMSDVFAARKDLAGPRQGPNPQVLQALLQYLNPAPAQVPSRIVPPPLTLLDNRTAPVVLNNPRPAPTPEQIAWYGQRAALFPNAPGQAPVLPGGVAPTPIPGPLSAPAAVPTTVGPVTHALRNGRIVPVDQSTETSLTSVPGDTASFVPWGYAPTPAGPSQPVTVNPMAAVDFLTQGTTPLGPGRPVTVDPLVVLDTLIQMFPDRERDKLRKQVTPKVTKALGTSGAGALVTVNPMAAVDFLTQGTTPLGPGRPVTVNPMDTLAWLIQQFPDRERDKLRKQVTKTLGVSTPVTVNPMAAVDFLTQGTTPLGPGRPVAVNPLDALAWLVQQFPDRERNKK